LRSLPVLLVLLSHLISGVGLLLVQFVKSLIQLLNELLALSSVCNIGFQISDSIADILKEVFNLGILCLHQRLIRAQALKD